MASRISTHAPEADPIGAGALTRPKSSLYGWLENGEGLKVDFTVRVFQTR